MDEVNSANTKITRKDVFEKVKESYAVIQLFLAVAGVVVIVVGLWLASLISPLKQDTAVIQQQVDAQEKRVDSIDEKLDRIIELLLQKE